MTTTATDHSSAARRLVDRINGDRISSESTPVVVAELLEAQVHATLAVADAIDRLVGHLEDRAITVRSE